MNVVVLRGRITRPPVERTLATGSTVMELDLSVRAADGTLETVPVAWADPPARASSLDEGTEVVVLGRVRRRFFRAAGRTQSRTEVVARDVRPARQARKVDALLATAGERLRRGEAAS